MKIWLCDISESPALEVSQFVSLFVVLIEVVPFINHLSPSKVQGDLSVFA